MSLLNMFSLTAGLTIIESNMAITPVPVREHVEKDWMQGRAYHRRVQKKWLKRFGQRFVPTTFVAGNRIYVHPEIAKAIHEHVPFG